MMISTRHTFFSFLLACLFFPATINSFVSSSLEESKTAVMPFEKWIKKQTRTSLRAFFDEGRGIFDLEGNGEIPADENGVPHISLKDERKHFYYFLFPEETETYLSINKQLHSALTKQQFGQLIKKNNAFIERLYNLKNGFYASTKKTSISNSKTTIEVTNSTKNPRVMNDQFTEWLNTYTQRELLAFLNRSRCDYGLDGLLPEGAIIADKSWRECPYYSLSTNPEREKEYLALNEKLTKPLSVDAFEKLKKEHVSLLKQLYNAKRDKFEAVDADVV